jgi:hypothetical protein
MKGVYYTEEILKFFEEEARKQKARPQREYMTLDLVWWSQFTHIALALEHENSHKRINSFLDEEVSHLLDIRADRKVGIFYPSVGDEKILVKNIEERLRYRFQGRPIPYERYLFILGFPTRKQGKPAIQFKPYYFDEKGKPTIGHEYVILQAECK